MAEIELAEKKSFSSEEFISDSDSAKSKLKKKRNIKPYLFAIFILFIIISITLSFIYRSSTLSLNTNNTLDKPSLESTETQKKIEQRKVIPYETPNKIRRNTRLFIIPLP